MRIVLVGPPGSGKTTFLKKLSENNVQVFNSDVFIKEIYKKNEEGYKIIEETFGKEYVNDTEVNREKLRSLILQDQEKLLLLNEKIHPIIKNYLEEKENYVAELPIINNSPIKFSYDKMVLVTATDKILEERLKVRNIRNQDFIKLILSKWSNKIKYDYIIDTTTGINDKQVKDFIKKFHLNKM